MKVLSDGGWRRPWSLQIDCCFCRGRFLVEERDVIAYGYFAPLYYARCVQCGKYNRLPTAKVSARVRQHAETERSAVP